MTIEAELEARIIAAIEALGMTGLKIVGSWRADREGPEDEAVLTVSVAPRSYSRFTVCEVVFPVSLELVVPVDLDPQGTMFAEYAGGISALLHSWNMNRANEAKVALAVENALSIGGVRISGGSGPDLDRSAGERSVVFSMEIVGFIRHAQTTTNTNQGE